MTPNRPDHTDAILRLSDAGYSPGAIAADLSLSAGRVYSVLRRERSDRARSPRRRTSEKRQQVLFLIDQGVRPARVAVLLGCSRAYAYRIAKEERA